MKEKSWTLILAILMMFTMVRASEAIITNAYLNNKAQFILDNPTLSLESFENGTNNAAYIFTTACTITWQGDFQDFPRINLNPFATDGSRSIECAMFPEAVIKFNFDSAIYAFGINMYDFGTTGPSTLSFSNEFGDSHIFNILPGGNDFIGVTSDVAFLSASLTKHGGYGGEDTIFWDEVYYTSPVPEPSTVILLGVGLISFAGARRKKLKK